MRREANLQHWKLQIQERTSAALRLLKAEEFDLIISDIGRADGESGLAAIPDLKTVAPEISIILYVGRLEPGVPPGVFGITNDPEDLIHLVIDVMERRRA